jgi:hypothetical protein
MKQPNEDNFDNAFKQAFENVSLAPPDIIWTNIESSLPQVAPVGASPAVGGISTTAKLLLGTGVVLISAITYFNLKESFTDNTKPNLNPIINENIISKPIQPAIVEPKIEVKKLVSNPTFFTKVKVKSEPFMMKEIIDDAQEKNILENEVIALPKIEENTIEMAARAIKMPKIIMEMPNLVPDSDSQNVAPYYDPNALITPTNNKGKFWKKFKISGGIRVSN